MPDILDPTITLQTNPVPSDTKLSDPTISKTTVDISSLELQYASTLGSVVDAAGSIYQSQPGADISLDDIFQTSYYFQSMLSEIQSRFDLANAFIQLTLAQQQSLLAEAAQYDRWAMTSDTLTATSQQSQMELQALTGSFDNFLAFATTLTARNESLLSSLLNGQSPSPSAPVVSLAADTGASSTDKITSDAHLSIAGLATGAVLSYVVDGGAAVASYDPTTLGQGAHTVAVTQKDGAGHVSAAGSISFVLDTVANAPGLALAQDTGSSPADGITRDASLSPPAAVEKGAILSYVVDGGAASATYDPASLADGAHTVAVTQTDLAGNISQAGSLSLVLDRIANAPVVALTTDTGLSHTDGVTSDAHLSLTGVEKAAVLSYVVDGGPATASYDPSALAPGSHVVAVTQTDVAGNVSSAGSASFVFDTVAPAQLGVALAHDTGAFQTDGLTNDASLVFSGQEQGAGIEYSLDGKTWGAAFVAKEGVNDLFVHQVDLAGNVGASTEFVFTLDTTAPKPVVANVSDKLLTGTSEANSVVNVYDNGHVMGTVKAGADGSWSLANTLSGNAIHSLTETAIDLAGNSGASAGATVYAAANKLALVGGAGDDVLIGRANDTLTGGAGHDTFVFNPSFGKETVTDFQAGVDTLRFDHTLFSSFASVQSHAQQVGADAVIKYDSGNILTLHNVAVADLHASDFLIV